MKLWVVCVDWSTTGPRGELYSSAFLSLCTRARELFTSEDDFYSESTAAQVDWVPIVDTPAEAIAPEEISPQCSDYFLFVVNIDSAHITEVLERLGAPIQDGQMSADPCNEQIGLLNRYDSKQNPDREKGGLPKNITLVISTPPKSVLGFTASDVIKRYPLLFIEDPQMIEARYLVDFVKTIRDDLRSSSSEGQTQKVEKHLTGVPICVQLGLYSRWYSFSIFERYFQHKYKSFDLKSLIQREFFLESSLQTFHDLVDKPFYESDSLSVSSPAAIAPFLLHTIRTCTHLSTRNIEGRPFRCTVLVSKDDSFQRLASDDTAPQIIDAVWNGCHVLATPATPFPFRLMHEKLQDFAELAQADTLVMRVDPRTGYLTHMLSLLNPVGRTDSNRMLMFRQLAEKANGLVLNVRGNGRVEAYNDEDLQLLFDGFMWHAKPYQKLRFYAERFFDANPDNNGKSESLARRVVGLAMAIIDQAASSILVFGTSEVTSMATENTTKEGISLEPIAKSRNLTFDNNCIKRRYTLDSLAGMARVDGAHIIDQEGHIKGLAYLIRVSQSPSKANSNTGDGATGTGRAMSRELSKVIPKGDPSFIVKISASGNYSIFVGGVKQEDIHYKQLRGSTKNPVTV
jgi:hypothetical protein